VERHRFSEHEDAVGSAISSVLSYVEDNGIDRFQYHLLPSKPREHISGYTLTGLRTLFVSSDFIKSDLFVTAALHEYIHCWISLRNLGLIEDQETIVKAWGDIVLVWLSGGLDLDMSFDDNMLYGVRSYIDDISLLKAKTSQDLGQQLFQKYTRLFSHIIEKSPRFIRTLDERYVMLDSNDVTLELESNRTLRNTLAGPASLSMIYGMLISRLEAILRCKVLGETSYEEAVCYMLSCGITGESLENFFGMTDMVNISWATKLAKLGVQEVIGQILDAENVYACVRELVERSISE